MLTKPESGNSQLAINLHVCCRMKEMGVMKVGGFIFPVCLTLLIFYILGDFPGMCHFITGIQSIYLHDLGRG